MVPKKTYKCKLCDFTTENRFDLPTHYRWKHPGTKVKVETKVKPPELVTPDQIADALLRKVINWATEKEKYVKQLEGMRELKKRVTTLEEQLKEVRGEKDRLLKIHNEQVQKGQYTSTEELRKLAGS